MGTMSIHFPTLDSYIRSANKTIILALIFTVVLFVTFLFTVYLVVRQKKITEMKNDFIHNMTHEFKTPISTISIAAQMLADRTIQKSQDMYARLGDVIVSETKRLRFQVEKVLQMSLYDGGNIALKLQTLDANSLIDAVVQTFSLKVTQNGGTVDVHLDAMDADVYVDEMHFTNIIFNLMDNAVKYRREDVELHLEVSTWNQGNSICIQISDNGIGIRREDLKRIFEKFYRVHTGNKHNVKGFGLGLAYVYKMVILHHGTIKATSELNKGTKFLITMPLSKG
jgi:two-component system phosphate regulon sensor histidine kinase PhoR